MIYRPLVLFFCLSLIAAGCATKHINIIDQRAVTRCREILVRQIEYNPKGLPEFLTQLDKRPDRAGDRFTIVQLMNGQPTTSFDIVVVGSESDFTKPLKVVYQWTGKGFQGGARVTAVTADMTSQLLQGGGGGRGEGVIILAFVFAPVVVGTAGGFIIGVADGIRTTAEEVGKVVIGKQEQVVAYTTYAYDAHDRLTLTRMYKADDTRHELVRTEYDYQADSKEPLTTTITFSDGATRFVE